MFKRLRSFNPRQLVLFVLGLLLFVLIVSPFLFSTAVNPTPTPPPIITMTPVVDTAATYDVWQATAVAPLPSLCDLTNQTVTLQKTEEIVDLWPLSPTAVAPVGGWTADVVRLMDAVHELRLTNGTQAHHFSLILDWWSPVKQLLWSPDGRYLALVTKHESTYVTNLYDIEGRHWPDVNQYTFGERQEMPMVWSPDGRYLYFPSREDNITRLHRYNLLTEQVEDISLEGQFLWPPLYAFSGTLMAAYLQRGEGNELLVMEPDGRNPRTLLTNINLVEAMYWLRDHNRLALVLREEDRRRIIILDVATHEQRTLVDDLVDISAFRYWPQADVLTFWAEIVPGRGVEMGYRPEGEQIYQLSYVFRADWRLREFWSPDGQALALKLNSPGYGESLALAYADGRPAQFIYTNLRGLGDPFWSPDGQYLAFSQYGGNGRFDAAVVLEVRDQNGGELAHFTPYNINWDGRHYLEWLPCH